jgi:hypothetical protein
MKTYLLLRNNKQTGPYTYDELAAMGLKAYDLVWLEGKSAAWRYPGEMEEFKAIAPLVEEQPFDRFYKRPSAVSSHAVNGNGKIQEESAVIEQEKKKEEIISIASVAKETNEQNDTKKPEEKTEAKPEPVRLSRYVAVSLPEGQQKKIVVIQKAEATEKENTKDVKVDEAHKPYMGEAEKEKVFQNYYRNNTSTPVEVKSDKQETAPVYNTIPQRKPPFIQTIAAGIAILSLVALGVLIGMNIKKPAAENAGQDVPVSQEVNNNNSSAAADEFTDTSSQFSAAQLITPVQQEIIPPKEKKPRVNKTEEAQDLSEEKTNDQTGHNTAVLNTSKTEKEPDPAEAEKEKTRKNIDQLISLNTSKYKVGVFGGIDDLQLTINNGSAYAIDQVVVEVSYVQSNKKVFKTETLHFKDLAPYASLSLNAPKTNRGIKVESKITYITSKDLDLSYNVW